MSFVPIISRRSIHTVPKLPLAKEWSQQGIKNLMSAKQFKTGWLDYQRYLTTQLSLKTVGTEFETRTPLSILLSSARKGLLGPIFHYASQAHNNHLFFEQLKGTDESSAASTNIESEIKPHLLRQIIKQFGSLDDFKNELLFQADTLSGNGWVYLIENSKKELEIIASHNDGTPYLYTRNQSLDLNGPIDVPDYELMLSNQMRLNNDDRDYSLPLIVINVWEYAYLEDYGVGGKADYLEKLWDSLDWSVINKRVFTNYEG